MDRAIVLYDDSCNMCTGAARLADLHGRPGTVRTVGASTNEAQALLAQRGMSGLENDTLIVVVGDRLHTHSRAVVEIARRLRGWRRAGAALWLVPRPLRDAAYRQVAKRRRRSCPVHKPDS